MLTLTGLSAVNAATAGSSAVQSCLNGMHAAVPGPLSFILGGVVFSVKTGLDYREYKRGVISKSEFTKRTKVGVLTTAGSIGGSTLGMIGGFMAGQALIPIPVLGGVIGVVIGSLAGSLAGGLAAATATIRRYAKVEESLEERRQA